MLVPVELAKVRVGLEMEPPTRPRMLLSAEEPPPRLPSRAGSPPSRLCDSKLYEALGTAGTVQMATEGTTGAVEALAKSRRVAVDPLKQDAAHPAASEARYQFFPAAIRTALQLQDGARRAPAQTAHAAATAAAAVPALAVTPAPAPVSAPAQPPLASTVAEEARLMAEYEADMRAVRAQRQPVSTAQAASRGKQGRGEVAQGPVPVSVKAAEAAGAKEAAEAEAPEAAQPA